MCFYFTLYIFNIQNACFFPPDDSDYCLFLIGHGNWSLSTEHCKVSIKNPLFQTVIQKDTRTPMFIAALFTIAKTRKQLKCPSTDEWIKKMWYIYTMEYYSAIKKEWNNAIWSNMYGPRDYHTKWRKSKKDKYQMISLICGI